MRYLFLLNPTAGKRDCTAELAPAIQAAAQRAGIPPEKRKVVVTQYAGHARELAAEAAHTAQADGEPVRIWTAGGDGTFMEAMTGVQGFANRRTRCTGGLRHPAVPAHPVLRRRDGVCTLHRQAALRPHRPERDLYHRRRGADGGLPDVCRLQWPHLWRRLLCSPRGWLDVFIIRRVSRLTIARLLGMYKSGRHFRNGELTEQAKPYFIYRRAKCVSLRPADGRGPIVATADGECAPCDAITAQLKPLAGRVLLPKPAYERFMAQRANV